LTYFQALYDGLGNVFSFPNILIPVLGTALSMVSSFLPGIGGSSVAALMILLTVTWDPVSVLLLFGAMTGGATFMGSITAILFNIPGNSSSAAAMLDGHPMTRKGLPKTAIACAATASALGSIVGVVVLVALLPVIRPFLLEFGPLERLLLGIWGLSTIAAIPNSSVLKALAVTALGLLAASIGSDPETALPRWNFGTFALYDGFDMIALLLGFFTITELMGWRKNYTLAPPPSELRERDSVLRGVMEVIRHYRLMLRSSILGTVVGIIPGVGGTVAGFVAYGQAVQSAGDDKSRFGKGDIRGLIAPEAAVDAKDGGSLLPALAFGLPGSEAGVILVTVFAIHGLVPGTPMLTVDLSLTFTLVAALLLSNILTSVVGVALAPALGKLTNLRIDRIALPALVASLVTIVQLNGALVDLYVVIGFGIFGYLLKRFDWPRVPFVIAFVLGSFIERNVALTTQLFALDRLSYFERPAALVLTVLIVLSFFWMARKKSAAQDQVSIPRYAAGFAIVLTGIAGLLAAIALVAPAGYPVYAIGMAFAATILCLLVALREGVAARGFPDRPMPIPSSHFVPIVSLLVMGMATAFFGLPFGIGAVVVTWLGAGYPWRSRRMAFVLALGMVLAVGTFFYLDRVVNVIVPAGWVFDALG
jgi:TctA family transporter